MASMASTASMTLLDPASLKPLISVLLLPPGGPLLLALTGAAVWRCRRRLGATLLAVSLLSLWMLSCSATSRWMESRWLKPPAALPQDRIGSLAGPGEHSTAIVVLGAGRDRLAPEYNRTSLTAVGLERLSYGLWLARRSGLPLGYAGGIGWADDGGPSEAEAAQLTIRELGATPMRWLETRSRDTRENAEGIVPMLQAAGVRRIVLVTHSWHMPRALRWFASVAAPAGIDLLPAPMGFTPPADRPWRDWLPRADALLHSQRVLHEVLGLWQAP